MPEKIDLQIGIKEINEISFSNKPLPISEDEVVLGKNLVYGIGLNININLDEELITLRLLVNYTLTNNEIVTSLESEIVFHIINLRNAVKQYEDKKRVNIVDDLMATLLGVSIGTARGILSTKTRGSQMAKFPLPIINAKDLISQMKNSKNKE
ncbi:hypothetical protein CYCD_18110 [Tenuifilaceae bacterium CYCD]|nr:hypothetical protein CYCD_18110 [Tenuifilaceae bacterium CYCD]